MSRPSWVVVPARDEADHIGRCLHAIARAAGRVAGPVRVVVVDDGSRDATAAVARAAIADLAAPRFGAVIVPGRGEGVGWARRVGFEHAMGESAHDPAALIATTDADSQVAPTWLAVMHDRLDEGHRVIAGDVVLDVDCDPWLVAARAARLERRLEALPPVERGAPHPHFAGSSLGFARDALVELSPLPTPATLEDEAILLRCRERSIPFLRDHATQVHTSARLTGRASGGLADALAGDLRRRDRRAALQQPTTSPPGDLEMHP